MSAPSVGAGRRIVAGVRSSLSGIPASLVHDISEVVEQEQALAREMIVDCGVDGVRTAGLPLKLERTPATIRRPPPTLGADNALLDG